MLTILLSAILIVLILILQKLRELDKQVIKPEEHEDEVTGKDSLKDWLKEIRNRIRDIEKQIKTITYSVDVENPVGRKSSRYKKTENIIKSYAQYLIDNEKVTQKDALIRAKFEFYKFGEDKVLENLEDGWITGLYWNESIEANSRYNQSNILDKDVKSYEKFIGHDLMAPMYDVIVKQNYNAGQTIYMDQYMMEENDYKDFIQHRALIYQLEKLGIIKKAKDTNSLLDPLYSIPNTNLEHIRKIVYEGGASHDDTYFEEQFAEGKLFRLFFTNNDY